MNTERNHGQRLIEAVDSFVASHCRTPTRLAIVTGAGVSAESGIPTFRGADGFWVENSNNYTPEQIATRTFFDRNPGEVWNWYLKRLAGCRAADPNPAHLALAALGRALGTRHVLISQNIDGLHRRAGHPEPALMEIHGRLDRARCNAGCRPDLVVLNSGPVPTPDGLRCRDCGSWLRPHVLWFDEYYEEALYRSDSALAAAARADLLLFVGTTGLTGLPQQIAMTALGQDTAVILVDPGMHPFSTALTGRERGLHIQDTAGAVMPWLCRRLEGLFEAGG